MSDPKKRQQIPVGDFNRTDTGHRFTYVDEARDISTDQMASARAFAATLPGGAITVTPGGVGPRAEQSIRMPITEYLDDMEACALIVPGGEYTMVLLKKLRDALAVIELYKGGAVSNWTTERVDLVKSLEWIEVPL